MRSLLSIIFTLLTILMPTAMSSPAHASGGHDHDRGDTQNVYNTYEKKVLPVGAIVFGTVAVGTTVYCAIQRWGYGDPCYKSSEPEKTSAADDKVTPDNLKDRPVGVRIFQ